MADRARGTDAARLEAEWAARVRGNREQVERIRRGPERPDFYAPVSGQFVDDSRRSATTWSGLGRSWMPWKAPRGVSAWPS